ncbi:hypothetical protein GYA28_00405 [Candidatus Roizmanbacteria bacterium]|jgi:hypothetical protein|nr:hypothetical protein [Candidatus Roizmanbacteria bacterium]
MNQIKPNQTKKVQTFPQNSLESIKNNYYDGGFDSFLTDFEDKTSFFPKEKDRPKSSRKEFTIFNYQEYYENEIVKKQIKELTEQVKKEIAALKRAGTSLLSDVRDIDKLAVESLPDKPGIYHIRFLEIVLNILKTLKQKVNESRTWLGAMTSRRKKRGSLFASLSKKKGTQYSLSQELQTSRSVQ